MDQFTTQCMLSYLSGAGFIHAIHTCPLFRLMYADSISILAKYIAKRHDAYQALDSGIWCDSNQIALAELIFKAYPDNVYAYLQYACNSGNLCFARLILSSGIKINYNYAFLCACSGGNVEVVSLLISKCEENGIVPGYDEGFIDACHERNFEVARMVAARVTKNFHRCLKSACYFGLIDMVHLFVDLGTIAGARLNFNKCLRIAFETEEVEVARFMIQRGATSFDESLYYACYNGNLELVHLLISNAKQCGKALTYDQGLIGACFKGRMDFARLMIERGAKSFNKSARGACYGGHIEIMELLVSLGANNFDECLIDACTFGHVELARMMVQRGARSHNEGMLSACQTGKLPVVKFIIQSSRAIGTDDVALDFETGLINASSYGLLKIARLMVSCGANNVDKAIEVAHEHCHNEFTPAMLRYDANVAKITCSQPDMVP
jgi:ankyrin repeat protein